VPSNHFLCGNYSNTLITLKTRHAFDAMNTLSLICIMLLDLPHRGIGSIVRNIPRSCSSSADRGRKLLRLQGYEQRSFVESIGGEESPSPGDGITLHDRYGLDSHVFHAILSGETNERRRTLDSCIFPAVLSREPDECPRLSLLPCATLHSTPCQYSVVAHSTRHAFRIPQHSTQHGYRISRYSIASYSLRLDFMCPSLWPSCDYSDLPEIPLSLVQTQHDVTEFFVMSCLMLHVAVPLARVQCNTDKSFKTPCSILAKPLVQVQDHAAKFSSMHCTIPHATESFYNRDTSFDCRNVATASRDIV